MTKISTPNEINFLQSNEFLFNIEILPNVNYFTQVFTMPGVNLDLIQIPTPHANRPFESNKIRYDFLAITFKIDENLLNYRELYDWMFALGKPSGYEDYRNRFGSLSEQRNTNFGINRFSDASLFILNNLKNPIYEIRFFDCMPNSISPINFDTTQTETNYATATAFFAFTYFEFRDVN